MSKTPQESLQPLRTLVPRLGLELLMVFLGVYLAFLFNEYQQEREKLKNQIQLLEGLVHEIDYFLQGAERRIPEMQQAYSNWEADLTSGKQTTPLYFQMLGDALPTNSMWQVALNFDGINLLDVPTLFQCSKYYNSFDIMLEKYRRLIHFAEENIIPFENDPGHFYLANKEMTPAYAAYQRRYEDFLGLFNKMIETGKALRLELNKKLQKVKG